MGVKYSVQRVAAVACVLVATHAAAQAGEAITVREKYFAVSGSTGLELYTSIGHSGPKNAIAHTSHTLKWSKRFDEEGGGCRLVGVRPVVTITYTLPKPAGKLSAATRKRWDVFIAGVRKHEEEHGRMIRQMVAATVASLGDVHVADDPTCSKVKRETNRRIAEAASAHKERSREFDRIEQSDGGNVHRLVLALVNGT
jgi:predicted secreted Zn-dependent protease